MASSQSHHHSQPLPPPAHIHHQQSQYSQHQQSSRLPPPNYPSNSGQSQNGNSMSSRLLPPLSGSPPYPPRHDHTLPPLSPYSGRPYPPSSTFPPPLSRQPSQHHNSHNPAPPPHQYHSQQHQGPPPPHYSQPPPSSHGHGLWEQQGRLEQQQQGPPPPQQHSQNQNLPRTDSSGSLNNIARRKSVTSAPEREDVSSAAPPPAETAPAATPAQATQRDGEDGGPPASDFVKKLAKMLDDPAFSKVVSWGPKGDCFVVKDMTEFTKSILPRMFKHSNFASFVRQLNKYDFHKIKNADDTYGDQSWTFHHPDFQRSNRDALENIKRKVPAQKKGGRASTATGPAAPGSPADGNLGLANTDNGSVGAMQAQIDQLARSNEDMATQIMTLERNYQNVLNEMVAYQRGMAAQDSLMQNLISYFIQLESGKPSNDGLGKAIESYGDARVAFPHLNGHGGYGSSSTSSISSTATLGSSPELSPIERSVLARQESLQRLEELKRVRETRNATGQSGGISNDSATAPTPQTAPYITSLNPAAAAANNAAAAATQQQQAQQAAEFDPRTGVRVFRGGQMVPPTAEETAANAAAAGAAEPQSAEWPYSGSTQESLMETTNAEAGPSSYSLPVPAAGPSLPVDASLLGSPGGSTFRIRKATFTPAWTVPPRVLLVDDDLVSRKLFSKFLQVSGCTIDVAVDGIGAVNKMNLEKYDLVLMDIVMPKLDGVSATSLIRQFDGMTPIISMTSNSKPSDVVTYYSSGMNDILPKPFTREGLFSMLEKHLMHLKAQISQMTKPSAMDEQTKLAMEDSYSGMLANLLNGMNPDALDAFGDIAPTANIIMTDSKRPLDGMEDERDTKRGRFEVIE